MTIRIYRDEEINRVIVKERGVGMRQPKELQAVGNGDGTITIFNEPRETLSTGSTYIELSSIPFGELVDEQDQAYGATEADTVDALNALFENTGVGGGALAPVINSATAIAITQGENVNYVLSAERAAGYAWDNIPDGMGLALNNQNLLGAPSAGPGVYSIAMTAFNFYGVDTEVLELTVSDAPYQNTRSTRFNNNDYAEGTPAGVDALRRNGNGSGSSEAWSVSLWFKPGTANQDNQTIFYFGGEDRDTDAFIRLRFDGSNDRPILRYGRESERYLDFAAPAGSTIQGQWSHILLTYDGGTTGQSGAQLSNYYSRFKMFINGVEQSTTNTHMNSGWSSSIVGEAFRIGRESGAKNHMRNNCLIDELAIWGSDQSDNIVQIYNNGNTHNLLALAETPDHWWRMGDGDAFPFVLDNVGTANFRLMNMAANDFVNDVP